MSFIAGQALTASALNAATQKSYGKLYQATSQNIPTGANTQITPLSVSFSGQGMVYTSNALQAPVAGIYSVNWTVTFSATGSGFVNRSFIEQNSNVVAYGSSCYQPINGSDAFSSGSTLLDCAAGDSITLWFYQASGGTIATVAGAVFTYICMQFVGSA